MKEIKEVNVVGNRVYIDDNNLKQYFKCEERVFQRHYFGPMKGKSTWQNVTVNLYKAHGSKGFSVGLGAIQWVNKHSDTIEFKIENISPERGPIGPLLIPDKLKNSPKFKVNGKDRYYFYEALDACMSNTNGNIRLPTGCHSKGTKVIMFDGSLKNVEDVLIGDKLLGPDSTPRLVKSLCRGKGLMYKVIPNRGGKPFICNEDHILSLKFTNGTKDKRYKDGSITNIKIKDYLETTKSYKHITKLYRVDVDFPERKLKYDPYVVGCYLSDGTKKSCEICTHEDDIEIFNYLECWANNNNLQYSYKKSKSKSKIISFRTESNYVNPFRDFVKKLVNEKNERHIPKEFLINSRKNRLKLLAGILDCDGSLSKNCFDLIVKDKSYADQVCFLSNSLGLSCKVSSCTKKINSINFEGVYYRLSISGNTEEIPTLLPRKKATTRSINKDNKVTGFKVKKLEEDNFYGFSLDKDNLYLLEDFTVTHNSGKSAIQLTLAYNTSKYVGTTMIIVPTLTIKEQFIESGINFGVNIKDYDDYNTLDEKGTIFICTHHIIVERLNSKDIKVKKAIREKLNTVDAVLLDETQHTSCKSWFDILMSLDNCQRLHGFSAMPVAYDINNSTHFNGLNTNDAKVVAMVGDLLYGKNADELKDFLNLPTLINLKNKWKDNTSKHQKAKDWHKIRKAITENKSRTKLIAQIMQHFVDNGYKIATFVNQKDHAKEILENTSNGIACWFGSGIAFDNNKEIEVNYIRDNFGDDIKGLIFTSHAIEGLDFSNPLNILLLHEGRSVRQTVQKVGRIVRPDTKSSIVINLCDRNCNILPKQANQRAGDIIKEFKCKTYNCSTLSDMVETVQLIEEERNK